MSHQSQNCCYNCKNWFEKIFKCIFVKKRTSQIVPITVTTHHQQKKPITESYYYSYKRIEHLKSMMDRYCGKYDHCIPKEVIETVRQNINGKYTTRHFVRQILRRENLNKYYEYTYNITQIINRGPDYAPLIQDYQREEFLRMFREIQEPFEKAVGGTSRKSFLPYSYVLIKFCELKGYNLIKSELENLKSLEKLIQLDKIWKKICQELKWEFIPTVHWP